MQWLLWSLETQRIDCLVKGVNEPVNCVLHETQLGLQHASCGPRTRHADHTRHAGYAHVMWITRTNLQYGSCESRICHTNHAHIMRVTHTSWLSGSPCGSRKSCEGNAQRSAPCATRVMHESCMRVMHASHAWFVITHTRLQRHALACHTLHMVALIIFKIIQYTYIIFHMCIALYRSSLFHRALAGKHKFLRRQNITHFMVIKSTVFARATNTAKKSVEKILLFFVLRMISFPYWKIK